MKSYNKSKVMVLIIAKLLMHDEPILVRDITDYINNGPFGINETITSREIVGLIKKHCLSPPLNNVKAHKRYHENLSGYSLRRR